MPAAVSVAPLETLSSSPRANSAQHTRRPGQRNVSLIAIASRDTAILARRVEEGGGGESPCSCRVENFRPYTEKNNNSYFPETAPGPNGFRVESEKNVRRFRSANKSSANERRQSISAFATFRLFKRISFGNGRPPNATMVVYLLAISGKKMFTNNICRSPKESSPVGDYEIRSNGEMNVGLFKRTRL